MIKMSYHVEYTNVDLGAHANPWLLQHGYNVTISPMSLTASAGRGLNGVLLSFRATTPVLPLQVQ